MRYLFLAGLAFFLITAARANHFYPPLPAAKPFIDFDNHGFLIHGQRTWICSAGIEYARVPHELWRDRLLKIKRAGFNCVEIYAFWNFHETSPGKWDFTGDKDVGAFLDLAHELGLYVTVRVGPYVCAEWENGGFPNWLRFTPGLRVRQNEPHYLAAVDGWYDHILPIVASHQISRGGSVIMVQLENEDDEGWGAWALDPVKQAYFKHLLDKARAKGIDVLTFFSGMNHGGDPAPNQPIKAADQKDPWYTTEYWSGWFYQYGNFIGGDKGALTHYDRAAWRFLENGANGFNVYMFHGGSNFDHWNNNETVASYDYAAPIGQAGDLRPIYYKYKRIAMFAHSFQDILENCELAPTPPELQFPGLTVTTRTGPAGSITFLDNPSDKPVDAKFADGVVMTLAPGEVTGLVRDFTLPNSPIKIASSEVRILGAVSQKGDTTLVVYGPAGSKGHIRFTAAASGGLDGGSPEKEWSSDVTFSADRADEQPAVIRWGGHSLSVLALTGDLADKTYFIEQGGSYIVTGAPYVANFIVRKAGPAATFEVPIEASSSPRITIRAAGADSSTSQQDRVRASSLWGEGHDNLTFAPEQLSPVDTTAPMLGHWQSATAAAEGLPGYDDSKWLKAENPPAMGADGDSSPFSWYRVHLRAETAGTQYLQVPFIGDQAQVYLNGARVGGDFGPGLASIPLDLKSGDNVLAIFTSHDGRTKLIGTYGSIEHLDAKGLVGPVRLVKTDAPFIPLDACVAKDWWKDSPPVEQLIGPNLDTSTWDKRNFRVNFGGTAIGAWRAPFVCLRATLPNIAGPNRVLRVGFFDEKTTFYLNGKKIGEGASENWAGAVDANLQPPPLDLPLDAAWKEGGPNQLTVILENSHAQATIGEVMLTSGDPGTVVTGWRMHGGVTPLASKSLAWQPAPVEAPKVPTFYRTTFNVPADFYKDAVPVLRLSSKGMSHGSAWLNGHALGRYPERIPVDGLWLPECWIKPGANELVVLDEEGNAIAPEKLYIEMAASRRIVRR